MPTLSRRVFRYKALNNRTREHVAVAERALGHGLPKGAEVHHRNGNGFDNRPQNLIVCQSRAYHRLLHLREAAYRATGDATKRRCTYCKQWDNGLTVYYDRAAFHVACKLKYHREWYARRASA